MINEPATAHERVRALADAVRNNGHCQLGHDHDLFLFCDPKM
jgi:hypothetical protein